MENNIASTISKLKELRIVLPKSQSLPDDHLLNLYEEKLNFKFPKDYRYFLKEASDSILNGKDALRVTYKEDSPRELIVAAHEAWDMGVPNNWLPICEDNGDYYCITKSGEIKYWSHDGSSDETWPDLATWIERVWINEE